MRTLPAIVIASVMLTGASVAMAQTNAADPGVSGPYAGAGVHGFYDIEARMERMQQQISALPPAKARRAASQLKAIRADMKFRKARHDGELRDWDRELISKKLDQLAAQYPSLQG